MDLTGGREQIDPAPIDTKKVSRAAIMAVELVIEDSEDYSLQSAWSIFNDLSNDERIAFQSLLKTSKPVGTRKTYYSCFNDHLRLERKWMEDQ